MDLTAIRTELAQVVADVAAAALEGDGVLYVSPHVPVTPTFPCAFANWPDEMPFNGSLGGARQLELTVTVAFSNADFVAAQACMDRVMSADVAGAFRAHATDVWRSVAVVSADNVRGLTFGVADRPVYGVGFSLNVEVIAK